MIVCINYKKVKVRLFPTKKNFSRIKQTVMSNTPLPSVEEVNKWSPVQVINFLESKKDELFLYDKHIEVIKDQEVAGRDFLELNVDKLEKWGMKGGPAERITSLVNNIKGKGQCRCHYCIQIL